MRKEDIEVKVIRREGREFTTLRFELFGVPCLLVVGRYGFVGCGAFDAAAFEKFGVPAATVRGVSSIADLLAAPVATANRPARERGVTEGMSATRALEKL